MLPTVNMAVNMTCWLASKETGDICMLDIYIRWLGDIKIIHIRECACHYISVICVRVASSMEVNVKNNVYQRGKNLCLVYVVSVEHAVLLVWRDCGYPTWSLRDKETNKTGLCLLTSNKPGELVKIFLLGSSEAYSHLGHEGMVGSA